MNRLRTHFFNTFHLEYIVGNVSPVYMDFSYFPISNSVMKKEKLRFGIVLNHQSIQFELWLMGQDNEVKSKYWEILKNSKWNSKRTEAPKYAVLEEVLVANPDFNDMNDLTDKIEEKAIKSSMEILTHLKFDKA